MKNNQIISAKEFNTNKNISVSKIRGYKYFTNAIKHKNNGLQVQYNANGFPITITNAERENKLGGKFFIEISQYHCK